MNNIILSPEAERDLNEVYNHVIESSFDMDAAENLYQKIITSIEYLAEHALMGQELASVIDVDCDYRFLVSEKHYVFYRVNGINIYIDRILHTRRNFMRILFGKL